MKTKILNLLLILFFFGCTKEDEFPTHTGQEIFFQVESLNYAWLFYHGGVMIDSSGSVRRYNQPEIWNRPDSLGYITTEKMKENVRQLDTTFSMINRDTLEKYINKIYKASKGPLSKPELQSYDAGITRFMAFLFDAKSNKYKVVLIKQTGDQFIDNRSPEAIQIYDWMTGPK